MWKGPDQDPGGAPESGPPPGSSQELSDLKDQFEQQQVLIAQLKEMIRKSEQSSVTQEKVDEYMNTLSKRSGRAKKLKKDEDNGNKKTIDIPASQKINLLRQQVEENKAKFAERGKSQKGIEEMVTQLKAQLDDSQQLISQTPINLSLQDSKNEYSENSSSQELYTVLLTKEKRITDLISKVHKLESSVLDLQENIKEKDSVLDARTKAITLMTENLSRKGKNTLDALDETKEQMRKMQENFVSLESEMKARQMKLLDDLRLKNYEIAELQELNNSLEKEKVELTAENIDLNVKIQSNSSSNNENGEIQTLKKTIQELYQIKVNNEELTLTIMDYEATIKELNGKITQLKNKESDIGDENREIVKLKKQLDDSNKNMIKVKAQNKSKVKELTKKIEAFKKVSDVNAEIVKLEAENCRLNQKLAELEEEKGSLQLKLVESDTAKGSDITERELEEKIQDHAKMLEEKDKIISILEAEITRSKNEVETLTEKLTSLSHLENAQVTTEMASIQFEEQMDSLENEKRNLIIENETTTKEKEELTEKIDLLQKEKQEMAAKLEQYIQENMELVDKLEKLSAEKVSSAESIEIVEGLTQQEKLELEAYQKNLDMAGNLKSSEDNLPQTVDLNESVNELTEETSELLQKIELFTVERREVMEKMEQLKQENNNLNLKIKEIENNRDVLAETYEQLQNEKELLDTKLETIEKEKLESHVNEENEALKEKLEEELYNSRREIDGLKEEIDGYKTVIEDKKVELESLSNFVKELQSKLEEREKENDKLSEHVVDLTRNLTDLENNAKNLEIKVDQLEEQKNNLSLLIDKNQEELEVISNTEWENHRLLESKDNEITKLTKEINNTESVVLDLQQIIKEKDEKFHQVSCDMKEKYLSLQKQLEANSGNIRNIRSPLEAKIEELTTKNKEQLEKMKKIAANLKKKTQAYQELEEKYATELQEKDENANKISSLLQQLQDLEVEVSRLQGLLSEKTQQYYILSRDFDTFRRDKLEELRQFEDRNVELQNIVAELRVKAEKASEVSLQQELLLTKENLGDSQIATNESSLQSKIRELEMIVEMQEADLVKYRERVNKLEEGISFVEERRLSLERKANELGAELEEKSVTFEEMTMSGDRLEKRLTALTAHDEAIERKLDEAVAENQELTRQNKKLDEKNDKLSKKLEQMAEKLREMEAQQSLIEDMEAQNKNMKKQIQHLEGELKNLQTDYGRILEENNEDFDKVNADWQAQFDDVLKEKTELMIRCEKFEEELKEIAEKESGFNDELIEYKTKLEKSEAEIRNYEEQIQLLSKDQDDNQELRRTIDEKNLEIENYQKQNLQLQMQSSAQTSFFDVDNQSEKQRLEQELVSVNEHLASSKLQIEELQRKIRDLEPNKTAEVTPEAQKNIPAFVWPGQGPDPFDFVSSQPLQAQPQSVEFDSISSQPKHTENTQEELLNKIKTLEFMLFSVDKDKDDALLQCHELTNELTRLVYERENQPVALESQILTENDIEDTPDTSKDLQKIEFEQTRAPRVSSFDSGPVVEEVVCAKEAYLCFDENDASIDRQVLSNADIADTPETRRELHQLEFEEVGAAASEDQCCAKDAYLCYDAGDGGNRDTFGENDDGWGWGQEEARLEEEHVRKTETGPSRQIETLQEKIRVLELERENHLEEIKQLQIKSGKLIKKLKEFKQKNEQLNQTRKKSESDLFNLDDTIQEELKLQIQQVEKRLKETAGELEKERVEKNSILKRVEVLTSANERMVEMKEKQDIELLGWQQSCRDLNAKLEKFEWGNDGFSVEHAVKDTSEENNGGLEELHNKIEELNETIKDLTLDNEELQTLLEEQRTLRINAEKTKPVESIPDNMRSEAEYMEVVNDRNVLDDKLRLSGEEKKHLQDEVNELIKKNAGLSQRFDEVERQKEELTILNTTKVEIIAHLNDTILQQTITAEALCVLAKEKELLLNEQLAEITSANDILAKEKDLLFKELQEKNAQIDSLQESVDRQIASLRAELDDQNKSAQTLIAENQTLKDAISVKDSELGRLSETMEQLAQEWERRVDQRGNDVAESWKLHLESRETEFVQIEQSLRKEISELEEKINGLVNENNELRKNVDAEIRNEVDRVSALQQQISDRQQYVNELTRTLQEKQTEIDSLREENLGLNRRSDELQTILKSLEEEKSIVDAIFEAMQNNSNHTVFRTKDSMLSVLNEQIRKFKEKEDEAVVIKRQVEDITLTLSHSREDFTKANVNCEEYRQQVQEKNQTIATLTNQLQEVQNLKDYENENSQNLQQNLLEYQRINGHLQARNMQLEQALNEHQNLQQTLQDAEAELNRVKQLAEEKEREQGYALENLSQEYRTSINEQAQEIEALKRRLIENGNYYEELLSVKDSEIEGYQLQVRNHSDKDLEFEELSSQLKSKVEECGNLQARLDEQSALLDEENKQLTELRIFIEEQVMKIEELKKELFEKSNDYDSLIAEMDMSQTSQNQSNVKDSEASRSKLEDDDLTEPVSRAELDLALYMLHQRDVRCEELTVELTQLLEERDTLQLRLSNAIREKEELGRREQVIEGSSSSSGAVPRVKAEEALKAVGLDPLTTKLSELRSIGYRKDKTIVDEQELRRFQQMSIMQQHRDVAARLPPEAAARLVDASYTLSRDVQSPSKVLLNWLWGRSTPKVNNI